MSVNLATMLRETAQTHPPPPAAGRVAAYKYPRIEELPRRREFREAAA